MSPRVSAGFPGFILPLTAKDSRAAKKNVFRAHSGRSSDFRIILHRAFPPRTYFSMMFFSLKKKVSAGQWLHAAFVPGYSGGPVPDLHRVPYYAPFGAPE